MALLVCFFENDENIDWSKTAIYLDQKFYDRVSKYCKRTRRQSQLRAIVSLGYGEEYILDAEKLKEVLVELEHIVKEKAVKHYQFMAFSDVLRTAISRGCRLAISGDM
ncbi:hypothetical protein OAU50_04435 [Planctomycetota bacterium]|nr:hypothetical protein [Planctomycetota bacterium]